MVSYNIVYFLRGEKLRYKIEKIKTSSIYTLFTPDICNIKNFSEPYLSELISYGDLNLFRILYSINKM